MVQLSFWWLGIALHVLKPCCRLMFAVGAKLGLANIVPADSGPAGLRKPWELFAALPAGVLIAGTF